MYIFYLSFSNHFLYLEFHKIVENIIVDERLVKEELKISDELVNRMKEVESCPEEYIQHYCTIAAAMEEYKNTAMINNTRKYCSL